MGDMETTEQTNKIFFLINPKSGTGNANLCQEIETYFKDKPVELDLFEIPKNCDKAHIKQRILESKPKRVIAAGGDGTLKLAAEAIVDTDITLGILPTGSANGMAKELNIPMDIKQALQVAYDGTVTPIHVTYVNEELCIHLADIGFNAFLVKKFDELPERGMWTYAKAAWSAFWNHKKMTVVFKIDGKPVRQKAAMVVVANATKYGSGLQINPKGKLNDDLFEVIVVKEYAVMEIIKIWISKLPWNTEKIDSFQTKSLEIETKHRAHFQVDGEYLGKVKSLKARIVPNAIKLVLPK